MAQIKHTGCLQPLQLWWWFIPACPLHALIGILRKAWVPVRLAAHQSGSKDWELLPLIFF